MPVVAYQISGPVYKWVILMESMARLSVLSREQVRFPVYADSNGEPVDLSGYTAEAALMTGDDFEADPEADDWKGASWEATVTGNWVAALEVGPGSAVGALAAGKYRCWVRVTEDPAGTVAVRQVGTLIVS